MDPEEGDGGRCGDGFQDHPGVARERLLRAFPGAWIVQVGGDLVHPTFDQHPHQLGL